MSLTREGGVFTREGMSFTREGGVFTREGMSLTRLLLSGTRCAVGSGLYSNAVGNDGGLKRSFAFRSNCGTRGWPVLETAPPISPTNVPP